jgi:tripartite-type tricarboxylate transporter receptor subunit TctC
MERPVAAPPDVPADRVTALREGFDETMRDRLFVADLAKASLAYSPVSGKDITSFVDEVYRTPAVVARRAAELLGRKPR